MDAADKQPVTSPAMATPLSLPSSTEHRGSDARPANAKRPTSQGSIASVGSSQSHQEYLDSLVVPTKDEIAHIAEVQAEREAELKRRQRQLQRQSLDATVRSEVASASQNQRHPQNALTNMFGFGRRTGASEDGVRAKAATVIQRTYRGYRARREMKGLGIDASTRWIHAVREAQWREMTTPRARPGLIADGPTYPGRPGSRSSAARQNWKKVSTIARHAGGDVDADSSSTSSSGSLPSSSSDSESGSGRKTGEQKKLARKRKEEAKARRKQEAKMMGLQYFLEMVDLKHRYGANLRVYHEAWKRADTKENFFYWLDYGEGKNLDIEACPREQLEREQVRYLSREERQYYLVKVDGEGRLCWAKNGARIDTSEKWKDSIHGIVPSDDPTPAYAPVSGNRTALLGDSTTDSAMSSRPSSSSSSSIASADAARYAGDSATPATGIKKLSHHLSGATLFNKLLRKTVRKNTWIFVADTSFRLYVGIKNSGAFQHSSFLQGSRISAAGLIRIRDGRLTSLSPLSGHYRPPASNFRAFVKSLKEAGVDMSRVRLSKSYAVLVGLETYIKVRKSAKDALGRITHGHHGTRSGAGELVVPQQQEPTTTAREKKDEEERKEASISGGSSGTAGLAPVSGSQEHQPPPQAAQQKEEEKMRQENEIAVEVMQKLDLGTGVTEPKGQKGDGAGDSGAHGSGEKAVN